MDISGRPEMKGNSIIRKTLPWSRTAFAGAWARLWTDGQGAQPAARRIIPGILPDAVAGRLVFGSDLTFLRRCGDHFDNVVRRTVRTVAPFPY